MDNRILITGGAGYIGSHIVLAALENGYKVAVVDNLSTGSRSAVPEECIFFEQDISDQEEVGGILKSFAPSAVINLAGSAVVPESIVDPMKYYKNNTYASLSLLEECIKNGVNSFVFSSTAAVYGIPEGAVVSEDAQTRPINPYGHSKLMTERILADAAYAYGINYGVLRYFNVAGADYELRTGQSTLNATHLIKVACQALLGVRSEVKIFGSDYDTRDGTCVRDYIHVTDLADAHLSVLDYMSRQNESVTFNCGNGRGYSVREVLESLQRVSGLTLRIDEEARRLGDLPILIADTRALEEATGWKARYVELDDIVSSSLAWERKLQSCGLCV